MKIIFLISFFLLLCISCSPYPKEVEAALLLAGNNKAEVAKVLEHYKDSDELKFNAACFLISNMPFHKSRVRYELSDKHYLYFRGIDSICQQDLAAIQNDSIKRTLSERYDGLGAPTIQTVSELDIQILAADFLIDNIEQAFYQWRHSPLLQSVSFEDFKEWILPYRTIDEPLVDDKRILKSIIYSKLSSSGMGKIEKPIECFKEYVRKQKEMNKYVTTKYHIGSFDLFLPTFKMDCSNLATRTCNLFRACGIPVVYEFTPQWTDKDTKHYWCASPDSSGTLQPYTPPYNNLREDWNLSLKYAGKVYQATFAAMKNTPYFLKNKDEFVPDIFDKPTLKDVTERYHRCKDLTLPMNIATKNHLAYLSFFNTKGDLTPVAWGKIDKRQKSALFEKVPVNVLFFPCYIEGEETIVPFHNAFILRHDTLTGHIAMEIISCDTNRKQSMHLLRKYPSKIHLNSYRKNMKDACILATNDWGGQYDTLLIIKDVPASYWKEYQLNNFREYRFYRLQGKGVPLDIAELEFLGTDISGHKYSSPASLPVLSKREINRKESNLKKILGEPRRNGAPYQNLFDGDSETFARWGFFDIDFGRPTCISSIRLLTRNAVNTIEPNTRYQLLYYHNHRWIIFRNVTSVYNFLDIDSVPSGTLYWLRNLDRGKEELPFFYKYGKQIFMNEYL